MSLAEGMDIERVRQIAAELGRNGDNLREVRGAGSASMHLLGGVWEGEDVEHFAREWQTSASRLEAAALALRQAHEALLRQADEQAAASDGVGGASGGRPDVGDIADTVVDRVGDLFDDLVDGLTAEWEEPGVLDRLGDAWDTVRDGAGDAWDWATDRGDELLDWGRGGLDWLGDRAGEGWDAAKDFWDDEVVARWDAGLAALERLGPSLENVAGQLTQVFTEGRWPRFHEVLASATLLLGRTGGLVANVVTGEDHGIFDNGRGVAVDPRDLPPDRDIPGRVPTDLNGLMDTMSATYDESAREQRQIRITQVDGPDGPAYIVTVPGTNGLFDFPGSVTGGPEAFDNTSNLELQAGMRSASMEAVMDAMAQAKIPEGAPVMLMGHSQGGMVTAELLQDEGFMAAYNVTHMITAGSPNDSRSIPSSVQTLAIEHTNDIVPMVDAGDALLGPPVTIPTPGPLPPIILPVTPIPNLDPALAGSGPHVTQLRLDPRDGVEPWGVPSDRNAHHYQQYANSIRDQLEAHNTALQGYLASTGGRDGTVPIDVYLAGESDRVTVTEYETRRD